MMAQYRFKLKLDIPEIYPDNTLQQIRLRCHDSDGLDHCDCVKVRKHRGPERCCFFGRPIEPLAFYLPPYTEVQQQPQSPLYGLLPKEVRIAIFEFALADDSALTAGRDNIFRWQIGTDADVPKPDVAHALLQTCKPVYLEAYRLPMQLNGYQSYRNRGRSRPNLERICPWQYALIQRLDLSLQQVLVEGQDLEDALADWRPMTRHSGAYVVPRHYNKRCPDDRPAGIVQAHSFGMIQPFEDAKSCIHDGDEITLPQGQAATRDQYPQDYPTLFTARAMLARSITHLTLRISRTDWWTWSDDPDTEDNDKQLALDPACGTNMRPLVSDMLHLAESRRLDQHPVYESTWGASIGALQDLQTFELALETFSVKKRQLDAVVTCSQTWRFPLQGTRYELAHDGKVTSLNWAGVACTGEASADDSELEPIGLPEYSPRSEYGDYDIGDKIPPISPIPIEGSDSGSFPRGLYYWDRDRRFSDTSFVSNHDLWPYHFDHFPDEPWIKDAHEFEVRIVRHRRRTRIH